MLNAEAQNSHERLIAAVALKDQTIQDRESQIEYLQRDARQGQREISELRSQLGDESAKLRAADHDNREHINRIADLEMDIAGMKTLNHTLSSERRTAEEDSRASNAAAKRASQDLERVKKNIQALQIEIAAGTKQLQNSSETHEKQIEMLQADLRTETRRREGVESENQKLVMQHLNEMTALTVRHQDEIADLNQDHIDELSCAKRSLSDEEVRHLQTKEELDRNVKRRDDVIAQLEEQTQKTLSAMNESNAIRIAETNTRLKLEEVELQRESASKETARLQELASTLQQELDQSEEDYEELKAASAEQITAKEGELIRQRQQMSRTDLRVEACQSNVKTIVQSLKAMTGEIYRLCCEDASKTLRRASLREEVASLLESNKELSSESRARQIRTEALEQELVILTAEFDENMSTNAEQLRDLHSRLATILEEKALADQELAAKTEVLRLTEKEKHDLIARHAESEAGWSAATSALNSEKTKLESAVRCRNASLEEIESRLGARTRQCEELEDKALQAEMRTTSVRDSLSARITELRNQSQRIDQEHQEEILELHEQIRRLRENLLPEYTKKINDFEMAGAERLAVLREVLGPALLDTQSAGEDHETLIEQEHLLLKALVSKKRDGDSAFQELQMRASGQIHRLFERLQEYKTALDDTLTKLDGNAAEFAKSQGINKENWKTALADTRALLKYARDRLQGLPTILPELKAKIPKRPSC